MKIPKAFLPEKGLENKLEQLTKAHKTFEKEYDKKYGRDVEKLLSDFHPPYVDYDFMHPEVTDLAEKIGYKQTNKKSKYEYWIRPMGFGESHILVSLGKKSKNHYYLFARLKDGNVEKFCNKLEYKRKMVYPKTILLTGAAFLASLTLSYACYSMPTGNFFRDLVSWVTPSLFPILTLYCASKIAKYTRKRVGRGLDKYCIGMIRGDDKKALEAAFS